MIDSLGDRMKEYYENRSKSFLTRRNNVIIRIDGKAFHTYTIGLERPFDKDFAVDMNETMKYLCENIQGAKMGYVQSDEISIWLTDYDDQKTDAWFDYNVQKMSTIAASLATAKFNQLRLIRNLNKNEESYIKCLDTIRDSKLAMFDARSFSIPTTDEVINYFIWRQQDATRNSISAAAQALYSPNELKKISSEDKQEMMHRKGVNWNDYPTRFKRGSACIKVERTYKKKKGEKSAGVALSSSEAWEILETIAAKGSDVLSTLDFEIYKRKHWEIIDETPIFTQDKHFIDRLSPENTKA